MKSRFLRRLDEALEQPAPGTVSPADFLRFAGAIATSTALEKIPAALQRAGELPPAQLARIISQVQYTGDVAGLKNAVSSKPEYAVTLAKLARRVMPEAQIQAVLDALTPGADTKADVWEAGDTCPNCGEGQLEDDGDGLECPECHGSAQEIENDYHPEADYYTQGEDPNAH